MVKDVNACKRESRIWDSKKKKCGMKITERIEMIGGVEECHYNFDEKSLAIYYKTGYDLFGIQIKVADAIDKAGVHSSIEKQRYYSLEDDN